VISTVGAPRRASRAERHSCAGFGLLIATRRFGRARAVTRADQAWAARTIENRGVSVRALVDPITRGKGNHSSVVARTNGSS
jgi:hypothetical protein